MIYDIWMHSCGGVIGISQFPLAENLPQELYGLFESPIPREQGNSHTRVPATTDWSVFWQNSGYAKVAEFTTGNGNSTSDALLDLSTLVRCLDEQRHAKKPRVDHYEDAYRKALGPMLAVAQQLRPLPAIKLFRSPPLQKSKFEFWVLA